MFEIVEKIIKDSILSEDLEVKVKQGHNYTYFDRQVPSVTTILGKCIHEDYLMNWANYLGFKRIRYNDELNKAANIGTSGHNAVENYLKNDIVEDNVCLESFLIWWNMLTSEHEVEILGIEGSMVLPYVGGTYDLLLKIDNRIFLVDLKTSKHLNYKYFIQLAAYRHMLYKTQNINIDGCIVLQLSKEEAGFNEQALDFSINEHYEFIEQCAFTFISLVLSYYNIHKTEAMWKSIF